MPQVSEETWLRILEHAQNWVPPAKQTLIISPHPDDETLGTGGLIAAQTARGLPVLIAAVTDGEAAYGSLQGLAERRRREQDEAVKRLGLPTSIFRLGIPDSAVSAHEAELADLLRPLIHAGMLVVAPWINDWHPDHEACAKVARKLCEQKGAELISYVFWTWHCRTADVFRSTQLLRFEMSLAQQTAKKKALECHVSQLQNEPEEPILPTSLLAPAFRPFETFINYV